MKKVRSRSYKKRVKADVIILGCSLPGIVAAHKLKRRFGDTMAIMVLDLVGTARTVSKCNVVFLEEPNEEDDVDNPCEESEAEKLTPTIDNVTRHYIDTYSKVFNIPLPDYIFPPDYTEQTLNKLFQHGNGKTVECLTSYHNFDYLSRWERFELNQYQNLLDNITRDVFQVNIISSESERKNLLYYDQTTMEQHMCEYLVFPISKEIMRNIVSLVCGASPKSISVLFYLHQCYRTSSARNHIDGDNTRFREKLLGICRKRLSNKLQQSVADITLRTKSIKEIRTFSDEQVILETMKGESDYVCNLLAMALRPDELHSIQFEDQLLSETQAEITKAMKCGKAKKFQIEYEDNFWQAQGYSGDILSLQGPILWAMERPKLSNTGKTDRFVGLIGYLKVGENDVADTKEQVVAQLVKLFGEEAATPAKYVETYINDIFIPRFGDYVSLKNLRINDDCERSSHIEWGTLDIYAEGDVAAAIQAGHLAYLNLITTLRPQAQSFEDLSMMQLPTTLSQGPIEKLLSKFNYISGLRVSAIATANSSMSPSLFKPVSGTEKLRPKSDFKWKNRKPQYADQFRSYNRVDDSIQRPITNDFFG